MSKKDEALKLALEALQSGQYWTGVAAVNALREALASEAKEQPAQQGITLDGMTANEFALAELYAFQEATGCDTADQLKAQPQQEPVATLWQHGRTGRTRITMPGDITDCDADWFKAADLYTSPPAQRKPLTDEQITAGAIALCKQMAEACGVDASDQWRLYADTFKEDAKAVLEAAHNIKENT